MDARIFVGADIPMYAHGAPHPYRQPCQISLHHIVIDEIPAVTSSEVVQEILHRYLSLKRPEQAVQVASDFMVVVPTIFPITQADIVRVLKLVPRYPALPARDLLHLAVMLNNNVRQILSADAHFDQVEEIERLDPGLVGWETGGSGNWETGKLVDWETGRLGNWEAGKPVNWGNSRPSLPIYQPTNGHGGIL